MPIFQQLSFSLAELSRLFVGQQSTFVARANLDLGGGAVQGLIESFRGTPIPLRLLKAAEEMQTLIGGKMSDLPLSWARWQAPGERRGLALCFPRLGERPAILLPEGTAPSEIFLFPGPMQEALALLPDLSHVYVRSAQNGSLATTAPDLGLRYFLGDPAGRTVAVPTEGLFPESDATKDLSPKLWNLLEAAEKTVALAGGPQRLRLSKVPERIQDIHRRLLGVYRPYRRLQEVGYFFEAVAGLNDLKGFLKSSHQELIAAHQNDIRFLRSLLYLALQFRMVFHDAALFLKILDQAAAWQVELGPRYEGFDLLEKAMRAGLPRFMGSEPKSPEYEIEVVRSLLRDPNVIRVCPIEIRVDDSRKGAMADYRVARREEDGSVSISFAEAKIFQPQPLDLTQETRTKFAKLIRWAYRQFLSIPESRVALRNAIYIGVADEREELDLGLALEVLRTWAQGRLATYSRRVTGKIGTIHVDLYGPGFRKRGEIEARDDGAFR
jgi:hypothetical protein